jgi:hypothetical protein
MRHLYEPPAKQEEINARKQTRNRIMTKAVRVVPNSNKEPGEPISSRD